MKTKLFENALQNGTFLKTLFSHVRVDRRKRNFSKRLRAHYRFQSTPRNTETYSRWRTGASFSCLLYLGLGKPSQVSLRFQIDSSYTCGRAKKMRKRYELAQIFFENGEKKLRFQTNTDTCGKGLNKKTMF